MTEAQVLNADAGTNIERSGDKKVKSKRQTKSTAPAARGRNGAEERAEASTSVRLRRVHITLTERGYRRIEALKQKTDAATAADVVREALRVYEAMVDELNQGKTIVLESPNRPNEREVLRLM